MTAPNRQTTLDRLAALAVAPFQLGQQALGLRWLQSENGPPEPSAPVLTPPEHAIKRRG